jgi:hypothetical protein
MLEQPSLLLRPWLHAFDEAWPKTLAHSGGWLRTIVNPTTEQRLGIAAWETAGQNGWRTWLARKRIQVYESDDESLLMTLYRPWPLARTWDVRDAEERRVAQLSRLGVFDGFGAPLATVSLSSDGSESALRGAEGVVMATWQELPGHGRYLRFGEGFDDNPFIRMTALAVVLALPPWPGDISLVVKAAV